MREKSQAKQIGARARSTALPPEVRSRMAAKAALKKAGYPSATHPPRQPRSSARLPVPGLGFAPLPCPCHAGGHGTNQRLSGR